MALTVEVRRARGNPTEIVVSGASGILGRVEDTVYGDPSIEPFLVVRDKAILLAYAAFPSVGSGVYASIWKISGGGTRIERSGLFRYADLREWLTGGIVREFRPAKFATGDLVRSIPDVFDERYLDKAFIIRYRFDRPTGRFRYLGYQIVSRTYGWPEAVRLPR